VIIVDRLKDFHHILRVFDVPCELRIYRGVEILLRRALSTWKGLVDAMLMMSEDYMAIFHSISLFSFFSRSVAFHNDFVAVYLIVLMDVGQYQDFWRKFGIR